jgi:hypothetical protein
VEPIDNQQFSFTVGGRATALPGYVLLRAFTGLV